MGRLATSASKVNRIGNRNTNQQSTKVRQLGTRNFSVVTPQGDLCLSAINPLNIIRPGKPHVLVTLYKDLYLLFIIYANDIQEICHLGSDLYLYADDSNLFRYISGDNDSIALQSDLNSLKDWFKKWLLKLNINKCNVVSFSRNAINAHQYSVDDIDLEHAQHIKDLGISFDVKLNFGLHISDKVSKANSILGITIKRNFRYLSKESFVMLYKALVRSHLEYANAV